MCPCPAMRRICAGVNFGNIFSIRELVRGSPLRVLDIVVIYSVVAPHKSSLESFRLSLAEKGSDSKYNSNLIWYAYRHDKITPYLLRAYPKLSSGIQL